MNLVVKALLWLARKQPPRVITSRDGKGPYLTRHFFWRTSPAAEGMDDGAVEGERKVPFCALFLHRFHRGDDDMALHNHPWRWGVSLILSGGYSEERRHGNVVLRRQVGPGSINILSDKDFHRVDLLGDECWSLFLAGPRCQDWGFWDRHSRVFTPWRAYIAARDDRGRVMIARNAALAAAIVGGAGAIWHTLSHVLVAT